MKQTIFALMAVVSLGVSQLGHAHAGHDKIPGDVQAPHGGTIQGTSHLYLELVNDASGIKLYALTHEMTPVAPTEVSVVATAQPPKKKKEPVKFAVVDDHFEAKVDAKKVYRYTLEITATYKGKKEKAKFQVEPQG